MKTFFLRQEIRQMPVIKTSRNIVLKVSKEKKLNTKIRKEGGKKKKLSLCPNDIVFCVKIQTNL